MIYLLSLAGFFGIFSTTMSKNPVLPLFVHSLGGNEAVLGVIAAISPLAGIIFSFPVGMLADKIGRKKLLLVSACVFLLAPLFYLLVNNAWWLVPVRFFHGLATAILGPIAAAMIFHAYPRDKGARLGFYSSVTLIGRTLAPLLGGGIISYFAYLGGVLNYRLVYLAAFILALPVVGFILSIKEEYNGVNGTAKFNWSDLLGGLKNFVGHTRLVATALLEMAIYFAFGVLETYLPIYMHDQGYGGGSIGVIFSLQILAIALTKPLFGKISDRRGRRGQIVAGIMLLAVALAFVPLVVNYYLIAGLSILFGLGMSLATVATNTYVGDIVKKEELGASMGALSSIMDVGHSGGPLLVGLVIAYSSFVAGFGTALLVCTATAAFFVVTNWRVRTN